MRIITGLLKGRKIHIPNTLDVRPTSDRTKEGLFSTIEARRYIRGTYILDLFAGSGNLGFEAISRGAEEVTFVDCERNNIQHIKNMADKFDVSSRVKLVSTPVEDFLKISGRQYDFIFADPPYVYPRMEAVANTILDNGWLQPSGWFILEHDKHHNFSEHPKCIISKSYGRTITSIFTPHPLEESNK